MFRKCWLKQVTVFVTLTKATSGPHVLVGAKIMENTKQINFSKFLKGGGGKGTVRISSRR